MNKKLFWLILILAFILRFWQLGKIPLSLDWDEVSNAYNAYSILTTARDEYGNFLPLYNRSFDDYKPPAYMYLNVPTVAIFGLTPFAARLPSAVLGFLTIPALYFLVKRLLKDGKVALMSAFLLAISPWHLQFSRVGFEANVGLFFTVAAFTFFLYSLPKKKSLLLISAILFGLSFYSYHAARLFTPLLLFTSVIIFRREILKAHKKTLALFVLIIAIIVTPFFILSPKDAIWRRYETTTQKARVEDVDKSAKFILQDQQAQIPFGNIIHNRRLVIAQTFLMNYFSHFDFNFLFTSGDDNFRHHVENMGMLYLFQLPLLLYGVYRLIKNVTKQVAFIFFWLIFAPIAASFGDAVPHAVRSLAMIIPLQIISAYALINLYASLRFKKLFITISTFIIVVALFAYLHNYYHHYPLDKASWWQYGYKEAVQQSKKLKNQYSKINIDHSVEQAYIFWLFYTQFNPATYQERGSKDHFDEYYFNSQVPTTPGEVFIADASKFPQEFELISVIYYPDGRQAIKIGHPK